MLMQSRPGGVDVRMHLPSHGVYRRTADMFRSRRWKRDVDEARLFLFTAMVPKLRLSARYLYEMSMSSRPAGHVFALRALRLSGRPRGRRLHMQDRHKFRVL